MTRTIYHGEIVGSTDAAQMPSVTFRWGYVKAQSGNSGSVYIGSSSDVAVVGSTDTNETCGYEMDAGDVIVLDFYPLVDRYNLNENWYISDNAGDDLTYYLVDW